MNKFPVRRKFTFQGEDPVIHVIKHKLSDNDKCYGKNIAGKGVRDGYGQERHNFEEGAQRRPH